MAALKKTVMTVARLPPVAGGPPRLCRRLDIKYYPRAVFPFALLYFTGSDHYNRSLRHYVKGLGWSLSDHGLTRVVRDEAPARRAPGGRAPAAEKTWESHSLAAASEADVLRLIGVPWREPAERTGE